MTLASFVLVIHPPLRAGFDRPFCLCLDFTLSDNMASKTITGSCGCGNITWTSTAPPEHLDYCYCLTCQRVSGAPFMAWMGIPKAALQWNFKSKPFRYRPTLGDTDFVVSER